MKINKYNLPNYVSMFQPTTSIFGANITFEEFLTGILCRLNEVIDLVNKHEEFIDNYAGKIEELEAEVNAIRQEFDQYIQTTDEYINNRFEEIKVYVDETVASATSYMRAYVDTVASNLQHNIDNIALGQITVYDPTTGSTVPLQTAIDNLYDSGRENAITATEYDELELTATEYDALEITAREYDQNAKTLLITN